MAISMSRHSQTASFNSTVTRDRCLDSSFLPHTFKLQHHWHSIRLELYSFRPAQWVRCSGTTEVRAHLSIPLFLLGSAVSMTQRELDLGRTVICMLQDFLTMPSWDLTARPAH